MPCYILSILRFSCSKYGHKQSKQEWSSGTKRLTMWRTKRLTMWRTASLEWCLKITSGNYLPASPLSVRNWRSETSVRGPRMEGSSVLSTPSQLVCLWANDVPHPEHAYTYLGQPLQHKITMNSLGKNRNNPTLKFKCLKEKCSSTRKPLPISRPLLPCLRLPHIMSSVARSAFGSWCSSRKMRQTFRACFLIKWWAALGGRAVTELFVTSNYRFILMKSNGSLKFWVVCVRGGKNFT